MKTLGLLNQKNLNYFIPNLEKVVNFILIGRNSICNLNAIFIFKLCALASGIFYSLEKQFLKSNLETM